MTRKSVCKVRTWSVLVSLTIVVSAVALAGIVMPGVSQAVGQETSDGPTKKVEKREFRGRLPAYYRTVVDEEQRQEIYAIQKEYWTQIEALKAQLAALTKQRDEKVAAVLTPEQLKKVEAAAEAAKAKRSVAKAGDK